MGFGVTLGTGLLALLTWGIRGLQDSRLAIAAPAERGLTAGLLPVLLIGTLAALVAAGLAAWVLLESLGNPWRRAMLGIITGSAAFVVALVTWPVERALGRAGLLGLAAGCAVLSGVVGWRLSRGGPAA